MKNALISIIVPTYNRANLIGETLDSVLNQTYSNWECLVIDDGSEDYTEELLRFYCDKDNRIKFHKRPKHTHKGANVCRNIGLELCTGELVYFFDSDDLMIATILESVVKLFNDDLDFIFFNYQVFEFNQDNIIIDQINKSDLPILDYFRGAINLATPSVIWKKKSFQGLLFDPQISKSQELNFIFNLYITRPLKSKYLNDYGFYLRKHPDSIMSSFWTFSQKHLYSDLLVRNDIKSYFETNLNEEIVDYQLFEIKKTLKVYLKHCNILEVIEILVRIDSKEKRLIWNKIRLLFFKTLYIITKRDYQFDNAIAKVLANSFVLKFKS